MNAVGYVQQQHPVQITTPLGANTLIVDRMDGEESISSLYVYRLRLLSEDSGLSFDTVVGKSACVSIAEPGGGTKYVHGILGRFRQAGTGRRFTTYFAELYPKLWLLTKTVDSRIFQNLSVPDIVKKILSDHGVTDVKDALTGSYDPREYCVQYHETAFAFVSRLLEDEGIAYWFDHTDSADTLVLSDDPSGYEAGPSALKVQFTEGAETRGDAVPECSLEVQVTTGQYKLDDYNFETPSTDLLGVSSGADPALTIYEYPAGRITKDAVETAADRRLEELDLPRRLLRGTSSNPGMRPGRSFQLTDHPRADANVTYVVWKASHEGTQDRYVNAFEAFPSDTPFRPPRVTPPPRIFGCQTAMVVGKSGEEVWTDQYGRVKVKFHWDQAAATDETSSCWVRVSQGWAGKQWGAFFLPRIGQEVVITFLEGDPDRPIVTGCLYNAQQIVPYALPDNQTRSTIKSDSSKGSGGFNEIRFEDKKGSEEIFVQAQKDMNVSVLHDQTVTIKNARSVTVQEADDSLKVAKGNRSVEVAGKETYEVTGERGVTVTGDEKHDNGAGLTYAITKDLALTVGGKLTLTVTGDLTLKVTGAVNVQSQGAMSNQSAQNISIKAGMNLTSEAGAAMTNKAGATHNVEAGAILVLKGAMVKIN